MPVDTSRYGKTKVTRFFRKQLGKGNFKQAKGFMKGYLPRATGGSAKVMGIVNIPHNKTIAHEHAIDHLSGTLQKLYGTVSNKVWNSPLFGKAVDPLVSIAGRFVPVISKWVTSLRNSGLKTHEINQLILMFRNSLTDAVLEAYQEEQEKLPEDQRKPITKDDVADLFVSHDDFAKWLKTDIASAEKGTGLPKTQQVVEAINELEKTSGENPPTLKALQNDTLETIRELHKMGLLDEKGLFKWLK